MVAAAVTVNVTGTVTEVAPGALRVTTPLWVPAVREPVVTLIVTTPFPVPEVGECDIHTALLLTDQLRAPPPVLLMFKVRGAGLPPPCWAVKDRLVGLTPMAGGTGAAVMVNATGIATVAVPGALRVMDPL